MAAKKADLPKMTALRVTVATRDLINKLATQHNTTAWVVAEFATKLAAKPATKDSLARRAAKDPRNARIAAIKKGGKKVAGKKKRASKQ